MMKQLYGMAIGGGSLLVSFEDGLSVVGEHD